MEDFDDLALRLDPPRVRVDSPYIPSFQHPANFAHNKIENTMHPAFLLDMLRARNDQLQFANMSSSLPPLTFFQGKEITHKTVPDSSHEERQERCWRKDGRKWQCANYALAGERYCAKHYLTQKNKRQSQKVKQALKVEVLRSTSRSPSAPASDLPPSSSQAWRGSLHKESPHSSSEVEKTPSGLPFLKLL